MQFCRNKKCENIKKVNEIIYRVGKYYEELLSNDSIAGVRNIARSVVKHIFAQEPEWSSASWPGVIAQRSLDEMCCTLRPLRVTFLGDNTNS